METRLIQRKSLKSKRLTIGYFNCYLMLAVFNSDSPEVPYVQGEYPWYDLERISLSWRKKIQIWHLFIQKKANFVMDNYAIPKGLKCTKCLSLYRFLLRPKRQIDY